MARGLIFAALIAGVFPAPILAHHSAAMFDKTKPVSVTATVKELQWTNPHSWLNILPQGNGSTLISLEAPAPSVLIRTGFKRTDVKPGDKVEVIYFPMRDGRPGGLLNKVSMGDHVLLELSNGG